MNFKICTDTLALTVGFRQRVLSKEPSKLASVKWFHVHNFYDDTKLVIFLKVRLKFKDGLM